jgi:hypothetical protein
MSNLQPHPEKSKKFSLEDGVLPQMTHIRVGEEVCLATVRNEPPEKERGNL